MNNLFNYCYDYNNNYYVLIMIIIKIIESIIKEQNKFLLKKIADKYEIDYETLEKKYLTPSFYSIDINKDKIYPITFFDKNL